MKKITLSVFALSLLILAACTSNDLDAKKKNSHRSKKTRKKLPPRYSPSRKK
jgi:ABC-type phosphate/phosphonate transport system substrate-binding protein